AIPMMLAVSRWRFAVAGLAGIQAIASWYTVIPRYSGPYVWRIDRFPHRAALRIVPQDSYLGARLADYRFLQAMEEKTAPGDRIFGLTGLAWSYTTRDFFGPYEGAENDTLSDIFNVARLVDYGPVRMLVFRFAAVESRQVRIVETARAPAAGDQWDVHELR